MTEPMNKPDSLDHLRAAYEGVDALAAKLTADGHPNALRIVAYAAKSLNGASEPEQADTAHCFTDLLNVPHFKSVIDARRA